MGFSIGKLTRKVSKEHKEYFLGRILLLPVKAFWGKKGQEDMHLFLDLERINFLAKQQDAPDKPKAEEAQVQQ